MTAADARRLAFLSELGAQVAAHTEHIHDHVGEECLHPSSQMDRWVCPCGSMHFYCDDCGARTDFCGHDAVEAMGGAVTQISATAADVADLARPGRKPTRDEIAAVLIAEGAEPGNSIHSWRCEYPAHYGPCDCVAKVADALLDLYDRAAKGEL